MNKSHIIINLLVIVCHTISMESSSDETIKIRETIENNGFKLILAEKSKLYLNQMAELSFFQEMIEPFLLDSIIRLKKDLQKENLKRFITEENIDHLLEYYTGVYSNFFKLYIIDSYDQKISTHCPKQFAEEEFSLSSNNKNIFPDFAKFFIDLFEKSMECFTLEETPEIQYVLDIIERITEEFLNVAQRTYKNIKSNIDDKLVFILKQELMQIFVSAIPIKSYINICKLMDDFLNIYNKFANLVEENKLNDIKDKDYQLNSGIPLKKDAISIKFAYPRLQKKLIYKKYLESIKEPEMSQ